jgi:hypothetical protein
MDLNQYLNPYGDMLWYLCLGWNDVRNLSTRNVLIDGVRSSTLASHLAQMWQQNSNLTPSAGMLRDELTYSIL